MNANNGARGFNRNAVFTPSSRDFTLRHDMVHNDWQSLRCRKVPYGARNWPWYIHDVSILIKQFKSRHFLAHRQKCLNISSMPTAARCEPGIIAHCKVTRLTVVHKISHNKIVQVEKSLVMSGIDNKPIILKTSSYRYLKVPLNLCTTPLIFVLTYQNWSKRICI